jgi:hypothetical protein
MSIPKILLDDVLREGGVTRMGGEPEGLRAQAHSTRSRRDAPRFLKIIHPAEFEKSKAVPRQVTYRRASCCGCGGLHDCIGRDSDTQKRGAA